MAYGDNGKAPSYDSIMERFTALKPEHEQNEAVWQDIADLILLTRQGFTSSVQPGVEKTDRLFDSTAPNANDALASFLAGNLISRAFVWAGLRFRNEELNDIDEAREWLDAKNLRMIRSFNQSNLYSEGHQSFRDLSGLGTAILYQPDREDAAKFNGFEFHALPLANTYIDENADEVVDTLFRMYTISLRAHVQKWGEDGLGPQAKRAIRENKMDTPLTCIHAVYPRDKDLVSKSDNPAATAMPWASCYLELGDKKIIRESGFMEFPFYVPRWDKNAGERYGFGRGHIALPHVKSLNLAVDMGLKAEAKAIDPPTKSLTGVIRGGLNTSPGMNTVVDQMDGLDGLYPPGFLREALDSGRISVSDLRADIREMFYANLLQMPIGPMMTAYEFAKRLEMTQRILGPSLGRVESEMLTPMIRRSWAIMMRGGELDDAPDVILERDADIVVEYQGPLAKNQRLAEIEGLERLIGILTQLYQFKPDVFDNLDGDQTARMAADVLGVPNKLITDAKEMAQERAARAEEQAAAQQAEGLRQDASAIGAAAPALSLLGGQNGGR